MISVAWKSKFQILTYLKRFELFLRTFWCIQILLKIDEISKMIMKFDILDQNLNALKRAQKSCGSFGISGILKFCLQGDSNLDFRSKIGKYDPKSTYSGFPVEISVISEI